MKKLQAIVSMSFFYLQKLTFLSDKEFDFAVLEIRLYWFEHLHNAGATRRMGRLVPSSLLLPKNGP